MYGLPYYERGNRAMHGEVAPYSYTTILFTEKVFLALPLSLVALVLNFFTGPPLHISYHHYIIYQ